MRLLPLLLLSVACVLPMAGCGGGGSSSGGSSGGSTPAPTSTTWQATVTHDTLNNGAAIGEGATTATIGTDGTVDIQTDKLGHLVKASGSEWYGGPSSAWLLRLTYDATAKTIEVRRISTGEAVIWTLTTIPSGAG